MLYIVHSMATHQNIQFCYSCMRKTSVSRKPYPNSTKKGTVRMSPAKESMFKEKNTMKTPEKYAIYVKI